MGRSYICPICKAKTNTTTAKMIDEKLVEVCIPCRLGEEIILKRMTARGIPRNLKDAKLSHFSNIEDKNESMFITGEAGTGKSYLAAALLREDIFRYWNKESDGIKCEFITSINLLLKIKNTYNRDVEENDFDVIEHYSTIPALYIDDIGTEKVTDWAKELFYKIINDRYGEELKTIFTSNYDPAILKSKYSKEADVEGEKLISRIGGMCRGNLIQLKGKDRRF